MTSDGNLHTVLRDAVDRATDAIVIYGKDGNVLFCNRRFRDLYRYPEEFCSEDKTIVDLIRHDLQTGIVDPDQTSYMRNLDRETGEVSDGEPYSSYFLELTDGTQLHISEYELDDGSLVSIQRDVTDLKSQEKEARWNAELFRSAFNMNASICSLTEMETGRFLDVNQNWLKTIGFERSEVVGMTADELGLWAGHGGRDIFMQQIRENPKLRDFRTTVLGKEGQNIDIIMNSEVLEIDGLQYLYISCWDITEKLKTETELSLSRERLSDFNNISSDWYWETDCLLRYTYISPNVEETSGISPKDYLGSTVADVLGASGRNQAALRNIFGLMTDKKPFREHVVYRFNTKTGEKRWMRVSGLPFYDEHGRFAGYRGCTADVTDQVKLQERIKESQKLEAVGKLTGGVAHDFNNMLAVIQGNAEMVLEAIEQSHPELVNNLKAIMRASDRGATLTENMLAFSRIQQLDPKVVDLDQFVKAELETIRETMGADITIRTECDRQLWPCSVDAKKLENALINICLNAKDAMPEGGTLTLEARNMEVDETYALMEKEVEPGKYVSLIISDTGCGISPEKLHHVVEPFYTTKDMGSGAGLGLSMVYGFARQSKGNFSIYSEEGIGTTVRLLLPVAESVGATQGETQAVQD
ncbi:PAS domain S-box protein [Sneathiella limimaris]|uniref:PAS domain S-box protein n=1 Tax=Sneathiella limimaris TaxID=1964213 RepID=UPI0019D21221|nr:PAS domain S-box protein [Sneathiella limimaris]